MNPVVRSVYVTKFRHGKQLLDRLVILDADVIAVGTAYKRRGARESPRSHVGKRGYLSRERLLKYGQVDSPLVLPGIGLHQVRRQELYTT